MLEKITVTSSLTDGGDGSVYNMWYLTAHDAEYAQEQNEEGYGEVCIETVETFVGSNIHEKAIKNSKNLKD